MKKSPVSRLRQAVRLFRSPYVCREINRANRIAWLRSVEQLGDKWLLANPIQPDNRSN